MTILASIGRFLQKPVHLRTILVCALAAGFLAVAPYVAHTFHPSYRGLTVARDKDFAHYFSRFERVLKGYPNEAANGIAPVGSGIEGLQAAGTEVIVGTLFRWTGLDAPPLAIIVTGLLAPVLFLLFFLFFSRALELPGGEALTMTLTLFIVMFHVLTRVVHPGWSFVPAVGALFSFVLFWKRPTLPRMIAAGLLLGVMPYLYFWSWTWVWSACGSLALLGFLANGKHDELWKHWKRTVFLAIVVLAVSFAFFLHSALLFRNPLYPEIAVRASFLYQRTPESWPRTILLTVMTLTFLSLFPRYRKDKTYLAAGALLLGILLAMHQNVLHKKILMFSSHFYPHLVISTLVAGAWVFYHRVPIVQRTIIVSLALLFLAAGAWDYGPGHWFFFPSPVDFRQQYLARPIELLKKDRRKIVLTDGDTARLVTSWTDHGVVYTPHVRFLFVPDSNMAERYCMSELFASASPDPFRSLYIEYNRVLDSPEVRAKEKMLVEDACADIQSDRAAYLQKYGITRILWSKKERPEWTVERDAHALGFEEVESGSGWGLWERE